MRRFFETGRKVVRGRGGASLVRDSRVGMRGSFRPPLSPFVRFGDAGRRVPSPGVHCENKIELTGRGSAWEVRIRQ